MELFDVLVHLGLRPCAKVTHAANLTDDRPHYRLLQKRVMFRFAADPTLVLEPPAVSTNESTSPALTIAHDAVLTLRSVYVLSGATSTADAWYSYINGGVDTALALLVVDVACAVP